MYFGNVEMSIFSQNSKESLNKKKVNLLCITKQAFFLHTLIFVTKRWQEIQN